MCILTPFKKKITVEQTSHLLFQNIWVHFGLPTSIVSDRDSQFVGSFWLTLWDMMETKLKKSTTFHPQIDGQTEVVKRIVIHLPRVYCSKHPKLWDEQLHYIQHAYIRRFHVYNTHFCDFGNFPSNNFLFFSGNFWFLGLLEFQKPVLFGVLDNLQAHIVHEKKKSSCLSVFPRFYMNRVFCSFF